MKRTIEVETDDNFETCDDCIHSDDATVICIARGCIHAIPRGYIAERYQPKERVEE